MDLYKCDKCGLKAAAASFPVATTYSACTSPSGHYFIRQPDPPSPAEVFEATIADATHHLNHCTGVLTGEHGALVPCGLHLPPHPVPYVSYLALCEVMSGRILMKPDQMYVFINEPGCTMCASYAHEATP